MKLLYLGAGFVGACSAAVMADSGHDILVYDVDENRIKMLGSGDRELIQNCLFEDGLGDLLVQNNHQIKFSSDYSRVIKNLDTLDAVFMCLPTPEKKDSQGESDLSYYYSAVEDLAKNLAQRNNGEQTKYIVMVNKSTVPIEMIDETDKIMKKYGVKNFGLVSNPEFLVEGKAIYGSLKPDRIVVGAWNEQDFKIIRNIYQRFYSSPTVKYIEVNPKEAAAGKLLANYYLFSKLAICYDVIGRTCETFDNLHFENLRKIISSDPRLGSWGLYDSFFAGGSCFSKDTSSLAYQLEKKGVDVSYTKEVLRVNNHQCNNFYNRASSEAGFNLKDKVVAVLGVAFKRDTNDVRNSGAIEIVNKLIGDSVKEIRINDPAAMLMFKKVFNSSVDSRYKVINYFNSEKEVLSGTDVCMILTDWPKFRELGDVIKNACPTPYLIMDGRRMLSAQFDELQDLGYDIIAVGSPFLKGKK
ncbi:MAG: nucleotide sugar dehydrogenase [Patescibacteria group bacterium]